MVTGIDSFKEWFKGSEEQYAIIGGTACDILVRMAIQNFSKNPVISTVSGLVG